MQKVVKNNTHPSNISRGKPAPAKQRCWTLTRTWTHCTRSNEAFSRETKRSNAKRPAWDHCTLSCQSCHSLPIMDTIHTQRETDEGVHTGASYQKIGKRNKITGQPTICFFFLTALDQRQVNMPKKNGLRCHLGAFVCVLLPPLLASASSAYAHLCHPPLWRSAMIISGMCVCVCFCLIVWQVGVGGDERGK